MKRLLASSAIVAACALGVAPAVAHAQTVTVRGTVTDETGTPVPGVQVVVVGTPLGATTDDVGRYRIVGAAPGALQVRATRIGYAPATLAVTAAEGGAAANLSLRHSATTLSSVVVTGVFDARSAREASVAITTLDTNAIRLAVPVSSADVLKKVPGVFVNSALGEIRNIVYSRGVSAGSVEADRGYFYVSMQEDGLPVTSVTGGNYGPDYFFRADATVARVEAVRGGSASITTANAPGGIFNYRSQTGGTEGAGRVSFRGGTQGSGNNPYSRADLTYGGPISADWTYNVGGFYRHDRGQRDAGYPMNVGGQIKANATRQLAGGGYLRLYGKYLNDRNGWFEFIPAVNFSDPTIAGGFDANSSVLLPKVQATFHSGLRNKDVTIDPSHLIRSQDRMAGADFSKEFGGGWTFDNNAKFSSKDRNWQSSAVNFTSSLTDVLPYVFNGVLTSSGVYTFRNAATGAAVATVDRTNPFAPKVTSSTLGGGDATLSSLALSMQGNVNEVMDQFRFSKKVGTQRFTAGGYFSNASITQYGGIGGFGQMTFAPRPQLLAISYVDPTGKAYQVTSPNGLGTSRGDNKDVATWRQGSAFFGHSWGITPRLNFDWGVRGELVLARGSNTDNVNAQSTTGGADNNPLTLYDNTLFSSYNTYHYDETMRTFSASGGLNYLVNNDVAVYVRGSRGQKTPDLMLFTNIDTPFLERNVNPVNQKILQVEGGVKFQRGAFRAVATPFYSNLTDILFQQALQNADGTFYAGPALLNAIRTMGVEFETGGSIGNGFGVQAALTLQSAKATKWQLVVPGSPGPSDDAVADFSGGEAENNANVMATVTPTYQRGRLNSYVTWKYLGDRPANVPRAFDLPAFSQFDAGVDVTVLRNTRIGLQVSNLTDSRGIMSWTPPGLLVNRQNYTPAQVAATPNAIFGVIPVQPRSLYLTLGRDF